MDGIDHLKKKDLIDALLELVGLHTSFLRHCMS